jgi:DDE domain
MNASDLIKILPKSTCEERAVHIWHLDEVYLKIDGRMVYLWRAVDAEGEVLDMLVQTRPAWLIFSRLLSRPCTTVCKSGLTGLQTRSMGSVRQTFLLDALRVSLDFL